MKRINTKYKYITYTIYTIIILLLIILILPFIIFPFLFKNLIGLINPKKIYEPLDVVIAHYKEDLTWVDVMIPENARVFIYTKSDDVPNCKRPYIHKYLENVGRDGHTYLYHIINNYKNNTFSDNILFLPGSVDIFYKKIPTYLVLNNIGIMDFNSPIMRKNDTLYYYIHDLLLTHIKNTGYCSTYENNKHANCDIIVYKFNTFQEFLDYFNIKSKYLTLHNIFVIKKHLIYNRPREYYVEIINHLNNGDNVLNGHFLEKIWHGIFNP